MITVVQPARLITGNNLQRRERAAPFVFYFIQQQIFEKTLIHKRFIYEYEKHLREIVHRSFCSWMQ
jgi:hypothetical protein